MLAIDYCERNKLLICASRDYRITAWKLNEKNCSLKNNKFPKYIIYGHHTEIRCFCINNHIGLIVSADGVRY